MKGLSESFFFFFLSGHQVLVCGRGKGKGRRKIDTFGAASGYCGLSCFWEICVIIMCVYLSVA